MPTHLNFFLRHAAWKLHRVTVGDDRITTSYIPVVDAAEILGFEAPAGHERDWCFCYNRDDTVWMGGRTLWTVGGRQVNAWLLAHVSEDDLDRRDRREWADWAVGCRECGNLDDMPRFYRKGHEFVPAWLPGWLAMLRQEMANG
ncbi:MAG: hypothetical protein KKA73_18375 [Chloroflexi bacterium]|nr:hypothetical protein [Chloroflexota bacterium]MBU1749654.1 hypothetical protein [Chloroflexota bacterium]